MNLTLAEIPTHRLRLRREIMEREALLASFDVLEKYAAIGHAPASLNLIDLLSSLLPSSQPAPAREAETSAKPAPVDPPPARVEPYVHPELKALSRNSVGKYGSFVRWAIPRMTRDFSIHDLQKLLKREGEPMRSAQISVVVSRLKDRGEIEQVKPGSGPIPALFRPPSLLERTSRRTPGPRLPTRHKSR
jgi:hypothetical protein